MRKRMTPIFIAMMLVLCLGAIILETQARVLRRAIDDIVYDNRNHYLPCEKLPTESEVRRAVEEHADVIQQIEQVNPGHVEVAIATPNCPGKADLEIRYPSHQNRLEIERILNGDTFFGIPYRLRNW